MERHTRKHTRAQKGEGGASRLITAIVVMASIVLIGVMIWLSPLGPMLKEHVIDPIAAFVRGETRDSDIVSALKTQDEQQETPSPSPSATPNPVKKTVETVHATPYYILQMGTFLETASAKEHAQKIMELGAAGVVYEDGAVYRVFAAAYTDEESLIKVQSQVRADGFEATPYITEQNTVKITLEGVEQAICDAQAAIGYLSTVPDELCKLSLSYDKGQVTAQETVQKLVAVKEQ